MFLRHESDRISTLAGPHFLPEHAPDKKKCGGHMGGGGLVPVRKILKESAAARPAPVTPAPGAREAGRKLDGKGRKGSPGKPTPLAREAWRDAPGELLDGIGPPLGPPFVRHLHPEPDAEAEPSRGLSRPAEGGEEHRHPLAQGECRRPHTGPSRARTKP